MSYMPFDMVGADGGAGRPQSRPGRRIAVIGSGISGSAAAWLLSSRHDVTLYEADSRLGGHSNTIDVVSPHGMTPVDTGFIVFNETNYPHFTALLDHLGVESKPSNMSFAVSLEDGKLEYVGKGLAGMFAQRRNVFRAGYWRMLAELVHFYRHAPEMRRGRDLSDVTLGQLLADHGYSGRFCRQHILPMAAAIWSTPIDTILEFPAASFINFFENHGLFRFRDRPRWRTVSGGSRRYVRRLNEAFDGRTLLSAPVRNISRCGDGVWVAADGVETSRFDAVVLATHADQALALLESPTAAETSLLGAFGYEPNRAVLHRDPTMMPRRRRCWASWNYLSSRAGTEESLMLTYWMNQLQGLDARDELFVTLNPPREPAGIIAEVAYEHPQYSAAALTAQKRFATLQGNGGVWFCGAHFGYGFHEDGLASAIDVAKDFEIAPPWSANRTPVDIPVAVAA